MTLYAAVLETEGFTVGQDNSRSGLFRRESGGKWTSLGWANVRNFSIATTPDFIFLACGNGVLRSGDDGKTWRVTTDWRITEVLDIAVDPNDSHRIVIATAHGIAWSPDDGDSWHANNEGLTSTFVQSVVFGSGVRGPESGEGTSLTRWMAGTEKGLFEASSCEHEWEPVGLSECAIRRIAINPNGVCAIATDGAGLWLRDGNAWKQASGLPSEASLYAAAVSDDGGSIAAGGYQSGAYLSRDGGSTWNHLTDGLTNLNIQSLSFDPSSDHLWAGTSGGGIYRLEGTQWLQMGLEGSTIRKIHFADER